MGMIRSYTDRMQILYRRGSPGSGNMTEDVTELMTLDEVAAVLKVSRKSLLNWRSHRVGPQGFRIGKAVRYRRDEVERWLLEQESAEPQGAACPR
jgi:predicted DNA-binding transcriptional regulator AlpA